MGGIVTSRRTILVSGGGRLAPFGRPGQPDGRGQQQQHDAEHVHDIVEGQCLRLAHDLVLGEADSSSGLLAAPSVPPSALKRPAQSSQAPPDCTLVVSVPPW